MSDERNYKIFLKDILDSMENIDHYLEGVDYEDFVEDQKTIDAVVRNIEIIGEATKQIPENIQKEYPEVPWKKMAKMRDKMIHGYFTISEDILWETVKHDIPETKHLIKEMLEDID